MAYFTTLPVPEKGAKLTALHLEQLGVDLAAVTPSSLSAMPGSRDTAVIKLKVRIRNIQNIQISNISFPYYDINLFYN